MNRQCHEIGVRPETVDFHLHHPYPHNRGQGSGGGGLGGSTLNNASREAAHETPAFLAALTCRRGLA